MAQIENQKKQAANKKKKGNDMASAVSSTEKIRSWVSASSPILMITLTTL